MSEWKATVGRVTLFPLPVPMPTLTALDMFKQVWKADPDSYQKNPNALGPTIAQGKLHEVLVNCTIQPGRIDFNINPQPSGGSVPFVDKISTLHDQLSNAIEAIKGFALVALRVALYVQLGKSSPTFEAGNSAIAELLPANLKINAGAAEDFSLQVNQRYQSEAVPAHQMNLIRAWSVRRVQMIKFDFSGMSQPSPAVLKPIVSEFIVPTFAVDITSASSPSIANEGGIATLSSEDQYAILSEAHSKAANLLKGMGMDDGDQ